MNPQSKYILFYSNNCVHSKEFINLLFQNQSMYKNFIKIDVQNSKVKIPKCVNAVPAIIIRNPRMKPQIYIGDEVFHWYNRFMSKLDKSTNPQKSSKKSQMGSGTNSSIGSVLDYDPCAMSGFSDNFAFVDNNLAQNNPLEHQFEFLGGADNLSNQLSQDPMGNPSGQIQDQGTDKSELESRMENLMAQRAMEVPLTPRREGGGNM